MESRGNEFKAEQLVQDSEIDVDGCLSNAEVPVDHDPDATEYSSSFGGTDSDSEICSGMSEAEVESQFGEEDGFSPSFDAFDGVFRARKKKLTNHWRAFIHPLMWRCKWAELKMKEIEIRASLYSRALETIERNKQRGRSECTIEGCGSRSVAFSSPSRGKSLMKRRKRKGVENISDITSYMTRHNLFSYLENRRPDPDGTFLPDDMSAPALNLDKKRDPDNEFGNGSNQSSFPIRESDMSLEQVLQKIELTQSRVQKLRGQLETVISQNAAKFSSFENLNLLAPCEAQTSCAPSPTISANKGEIRSMAAPYPSSQHLTDFDIGDLALPESVVSNFGEALPDPDFIESTIELLTATDVTLHKPLIGDSKDLAVRNVSIHRGAAKGGKHMVKCSQGKQLELDKCEQGESNHPPPSMPESSIRGATSQQKSALNSSLASDIYFPKNKRSRGDRKLGPGGWSRKGSGEPDS
ncbi:hypothetical protein MLD38_016865 [Melastoma candidum]|uniref:Uncharacterized protein n=1 Tax=Melastoma candidum TaxID=119954 RepID=A0ACB9QN56_9MYRT|nr:hypothetical protein MLD38_016865 [Melastoma candidum]